MNFVVSLQKEKKKSPFKPQKWGHYPGKILQRLQFRSGLPGPTGPSRLLYSKITAPFRPSTAPKFSSTAPFTAPIIKADYIIP
jgi:hypothetical protein